MNYVTNGSFEETINGCNPPEKATIAYGWGNIDSLKYGGMYCSTCPNIDNVPYNANTFQYPKHQNGYILTNFLCVPPACGTDSLRGYLRNRLKFQLKQNKVYCVRYYANIANTSTYGMDGFAAYFGNASLDTITQCTIPLTYLTPQVQNPLGNVITDTLNWVAITGTFVAKGDEKYVLIGNFLSDNAVSTKTVNPNHMTAVFTDLCIDAVSVFELDAPAYAGPDVVLSPGDSVYIGSPRDFASDEVCSWYRLPENSVYMDSVAGVWVKPAATTTYVVRQQLWCSGVKLDTVVVHVNLTGVNKLKKINDSFSIFPQPADERLELKFSDASGINDFNRVYVYNQLGQLLREEELRFEDGRMRISTSDLKEGVYYLRLNGENGSLNRKFTVIH